MTSTAPIRIGNCSGFYGDRQTALAEIAAEPGIDVITGDYLAEVTMLVLAKSRLKAPDGAGGYASSFLAQLAPAVELIATRGIKVVVNAGGLNPPALGAAVSELLADAGHPLRVAVVDGDDLGADIGRLQSEGHDLRHLHSGEPLAAWPNAPLTANAYLGCWGIARALDAGADVVVTGRCTDASLVVGAAAWRHRWSRDDLDALAGAVAAGHVIECGTQATGGNYSGFTTLGAALDERPAFPIAEIAADGSAVIGKAAGGGAVTVGTVTAQMLYEIGAPRYLNPDVVARFDTLRLAQVGTDRVQMSGVRGEPAPATTKVAITALGGHRNSFSTVVTGLDVEAKVAWLERAVRAACARIDGIATVEFEQLGTIADDPADQGAASMLVRCTVTGAEQAVGRRFGAAIVEIALANIPGFYGLTLPGAATTFGTYWPGVIAQSAVPHRVTLPDGTVESIPPSSPDDPSVTAALADAAAAGLRPATMGGAVVGDDGATETVRRPLGVVADARSGDKGGDANVGVWVRDPAAYPWLAATLTVERLRELLPETAGLAVDRWELPNLLAVNFVVHGLLGEGATANNRIDSQAKALGEYLRAKHLDIPTALLP